MDLGFKFRGNLAQLEAEQLDELDKNKTLEFQRVNVNITERNIYCMLPVILSYSIQTFAYFGKLCEKYQEILLRPILLDFQKRTNIVITHIFQVLNNGPILLGPIFFNFQNTYHIF